MPTYSIDISGVDVAVVVVIAVVCIYVMLTAFFIAVCMCMLLAHSKHATAMMLQNHRKDAIPQQGYAVP